MIVAMFLSTLNSTRYEYAHFRRYGTVFSSINEFEEWKKELYPKSRILFSMVELVIKIVYFTRIFPPVCVFHNLCEIGESIFKIHVIAILMIYIIAGFFSTCLLCSFHTIDNSHHQQTFSSSTQIFGLMKKMKSVVFVWILVTILHGQCYNVGINFIKNAFHHGYK